MPLRVLGNFPSNSRPNENQIDPPAQPESKLEMERVRNKPFYQRAWVRKTAILASAVAILSFLGYAFASFLSDRSSRLYKEQCPSEPFVWENMNCTSFPEEGTLHCTQTAMDKMGGKSQRDFEFACQGPAISDYEKSFAGAHETIRNVMWTYLCDIPWDAPPPISGFEVAVDNLLKDPSEKTIQAFQNSLFKYEEFCKWKPTEKFLALKKQGLEAIESARIPRECASCRGVFL